MADENPYESPAAAEETNGDPRFGRGNWSGRGTSLVYAILCLPFLFFGIVLLGYLYAGASMLPAELTGTAYWAAVFRKMFPIMIFPLFIIVVAAGANVKFLYDAASGTTQETTWRRLKGLLFWGPFSLMSLLLLYFLAG